MKGIKENTLEEMIGHMTGEWLSERLMENEKYMKAYEPVGPLFDTFYKTLTEEQRRLYDRYAEADDKAAAVASELTYKQGMSDFAHMLIKLLE